MVRSLAHEACLGLVDPSLREEQHADGVELVVLGQRGVGLTLLAFTTSTGDVTTCDLQLAARVEALVEAGEGSA